MRQRSIYLASVIPVALWIWLVTGVRVSGFVVAPVVQPVIRTSQNHHHVGLHLTRSMFRSGILLPGHKRQTSIFLTAATISSLQLSNSTHDPEYAGPFSAPGRTVVQLQRQIRQRIWRHRWILVASMTALGVALCRTTKSTKRSELISRLYLKIAAAIRPSKQGLQFLVGMAAVSVVASSFLQHCAVRKRQALDATSEWGRYAANPGARGRAVMALCSKMLALWLLSKLVWDEKRKAQLLTKSGRMFSDGLLRLGPLYIKLGQIVSCRDNLLPAQWVAALESLQDRVPGKSGQDALELAYASVGSREQLEEIFVEFDTKPLAAASLGQVHKALLRSTNETVAVKLQRPFLRSIYDQDLKFLLRIAGVMDSFAGKRAQVGGIAQSWTDIFTDAKAILYREIDYRDEAENGLRIARDFGIDKGGEAATPKATAKDNSTLQSAASWLRAPIVYESLSTEKLLVMEYVPSIKITDSAKLNDAGITSDEKVYIADSLARAYLRQFTVNMFFSTDPHPGNLGVERNPATGEPRLVMYDFGQACELKPDQADGILDVIEAIVDMNADKSVAAFARMGVLSDDADLDVVRLKVQNNFDTGKVKVQRKKLMKAGYKFNEPSGISNTTSQLNSTTTATPKDSDVMAFFTLPAEYAFVARALSQMHGVGKTLDPDFDFISSAAPQIVEVKGVGMYVKAEWRKRIQVLGERVNEIKQAEWERLGGIERRVDDFKKSEWERLATIREFVDIK